MGLWEEHGLKLVGGLAALLAIAVVGCVLQVPAAAPRLERRGRRGPTGTTQAQTAPPGAHSFEDGDESGPQVEGVTTDRQRPAVKAAAMGFMRGICRLATGRSGELVVAVTRRSEDLAANPPQVPAAVAAVTRASSAVG